VKRLNVEIEGVAPLLQHRFPEEDEEKQSKRKTGKIDYSAEVTKSLYLTKNNVIYQPSVSIEQSMIKAAVNFQIPGKGKKTYKDLINSALIIEPTEIPLEPQKYTVDKRSVRIQRARVYRYRPRFHNWKLKFTILILDEQLQPSVVKEILEYAGAYVGIGDYRPKFGRFIVTKFEEVPV